MAANKQLPTGPRSKRRALGRKDTCMIERIYLRLRKRPDSVLKVINFNVINHLVCIFFIVKNKKKKMYSVSRAPMQLICRLGLFP